MIFSDLDTTLRQTLPNFRSCALTLLCTQKSWSPTSTTQPVGSAVGASENLSCRAHFVCTSAHTHTKSSPHDFEALHTSLHPCYRELRCPDTSLDSITTLHSSTLYSRPSSPKSLHPHSYTHHFCTPDPLPSHTAPNRVVPQHLSTAALFPRLITSCTDVFIHVLAIPRIHDPFPP